MSRRALILSFTLAFAGLTSSTRADLVVSIEDTSVAQGGTGVVEVLLTSTASSLAPDLINLYAFQLQITNNGTDNTQLAFSSTQDFGYISNNGLNPAYVLLGDSFAASPPASSIGSAGMTVYPSDNFTGTDSTFSGDPVSLSSGTTYLLASLSLTAITGALPTVGDSFTIGLVPSSGIDASNTYFDNFNFGTGVETSATAFTSNSGTVTIIAAATVPEPASIICGLTAFVIIAGVRGRYRFRNSCVRGGL